MPKKPERILWKFQCKKWDFGFIIPDDRANWGWDFFVHKKNFYGAIDGQRVAADVLERDSGSKPEAKITELFSLRQESTRKYEVLKTIEWVFSWWNGDFGFVDVAWEEEGYFCYWLKKNGAKDGDRVKANIKKYNGKDEAVIIDILDSDSEVVKGKYSDNDKFGFVKPEAKGDDIFIAGSRKAEAKDGDRVEVKIIKKWWRRPEWVIVKVL